MSRDSVTMRRLTRPVTTIDSPSITASKPCRATVADPAHPAGHPVHLLAGPGDIVELAARKPGAQRRDVDVAPDFVGQCFRKLDEKRLGGAVQSVSGGGRHEAGQRRDVDDAAIAALDHPRQQPMRQLGRRHESPAEARRGAATATPHRRRERRNRHCSRGRRSSGGAQLLHRSFAGRRQNLDSNSIFLMRSRSATACSRSSRRAAIARSKPSAAKTSANASPMPDEAP